MTQIRKTKRKVRVSFPGVIGRMTGTAVTCSTAQGATATVRLTSVTTVIEVEDHRYDHEGD